MSGSVYVLVLRGYSDGSSRKDDILTATSDQETAAAIAQAANAARFDRMIEVVEVPMWPGVAAEDLI